MSDLFLSHHREGSDAVSSTNCWLEVVPAECLTSRGSLDRVGPTSFGLTRFSENVPQTLECASKDRVTEGETLCIVLKETTKQEPRPSLRATIWSSRDDGRSDAQCAWCTWCTWTNKMPCLGIPAVHCVHTGIAGPRSVYPEFYIRATINSVNAGLNE